jgi:hypothetical protein
VRGLGARRPSGLVGGDMEKSERENNIGRVFVLFIVRKSGDANGSPLAAPHRLTGAAPALSRTTRGSKRVSQN